MTAWRVFRTAAGAAVALVASAAPIAGAVGPHITAKPSALAAKETTMLTGTGFPAGASIQLAECAQMFWRVPSPCDSRTSNVKTDESGGFSTTFKVRSCPNGERAATISPRSIRAPRPAPRRKRCYIGEVAFGKDTAMLIGAVKVTVTS